METEEYLRNVQNLEEELKNHETDIKRRDDLYRLFSNKEFKKIVLEFYMKEFALTQVSNLNDKHIQEESIVTNLKGVASLQTFFNTIIAKGNVAENNINDVKETLAEYRSEGLGA